MCDTHLSGVLLAVCFPAVGVGGVVEGGEDVLVTKDGQRGARQDTTGQDQLQRHLKTTRGDL